MSGAQSAFQDPRKQKCRQSSSACARGLFKPLILKRPTPYMQVSKVRVRGASLGGEQELGHKAVRADSEWPLDR